MLPLSVSINDYYTFPQYQENRKYMFQCFSERLCKNVKYYICCQFFFEQNDYEPI